VHPILNVLLKKNKYLIKLDMNGSSVTNGNYYWCLEFLDLFQELT
jgi:hypothetical protein